MTVQRKAPPNLYILKLSFAHFAVGMAFFILAMSAAIVLLPELVRSGTFREPRGWLLAHMLLLGFASMIAIGASYQIIQVIMRTSLFSRTLGWIQFGVYLVGVLLILGGFTVNSALIAAGGCLVVTGIVLYNINVIATFIRKREWNPFVFGVCLSVLGFLITAVFGTLIGLRFAYGVPAVKYETLFNSHLWFGIGGWLSGLIFVFSYKLLPMFYVSTRKLTKETYWLIGGFHLCVWLQFAALITGLTWLVAVSYLGFAIILVRFVGYVVDVRNKSRGKQPIGAVRIAFYLLPAISLLFLAWCGSMFVGLSPPGITAITETMVMVLIIGWFAPTIFSYLSKILPFLWWAHRFRSKEEKKGAVLLSEMLNETRLTWELACYLAGIAVLSGGFLAEHAAVAAAGLLLAFAAFIAYFLDLIRVFRY